MRPELFLDKRFDADHMAYQGSGVTFDPSPNRRKERCLENSEI